MPMLDSLEAEVAPVHLLLIGDSKAGKSTYATEAAIDGFNVIYLDADNGRSAMDARIAQEPTESQAKIRSRINYFRPRFPLSFVTAVLKSSAKKPLFWLPNQHRRWNPTAKANEYDDSEPVWVIDSSSIPADTIFVIDSWTALAADGLEIARPDQASSLLDGTADQSLYGEARIKLVYVTNMLQSVPFHVIVQAHATRYEIYSKPKGSSGAPKQRDMTLEETINVPVSSSRAHGLEMASRFNHIGRIEISNLGATEIDFTRSPSRVGGGPPNKRAKAKDLAFRSLVKMGPTATPAVPWYQESTLGELKAGLPK